MNVSINFDAADAFIAGLALLIAIYSAVVTERFNRRQTAFEETAEKLNLKLIEKEDAEALAAKRADISVNFYQSGKSNFRLKVFNRGKGIARNVRIETLDDANILVPNDVERKFPAPIIEPQSGIDLIAAIHMQSPPRVHIRLTWDDDAGEGHAKELHPAW